MVRKSLALMAACAVAGASVAAAADYVFVAGNWGKKQEAAIAAAGGTVVWSHARTGIAAVTAEGEGFLEAAMGSNAFQMGSPDVLVQWAPGEAPEAAITPGDEGFYPYQWNVRSVGAPQAWAAGCTGAGARVAILDGGIYDVHADLSAGLDKGCSVSFVPNQAYNTDTGTFWHGTHVAGIVGARDNGFGVIGVAPEATLVGVKVLHGGSGSFSWIIGGILYAADPAGFGSSCPPADIVNMSLGAGFQKMVPGGGPLVAAMNKAVNFAGSKGVLVISAAGNDYVNVRDYPALTFVPADSGSGLAISATGPTGFAYGGTDFRTPAAYSNHGTGFIDLAAPGGNELLWPNPNFVYDFVLSTCRGTAVPPSYSFCFAEGTSMAAPAAAGVAALVKGANPGLSVGALKTILQNTADDEGPIGYDGFYGHGYVNAYAACLAAQ